MSADIIETAEQESTQETAEATSAPTSFADLKPKMQLKGTVKRLELYGAFIDLGHGLTGLIHVSKLGGEQVNRVSDVLKEGDEVSVWVEKVDPDKQQIMLTMVPPLAVDWAELQTDRPYTGKVTRLENFGAFVNIGAEREGLVHISELSHDYVKHPSEVVKVGDEVEVKVLGFNKRKRRIDLSMKALIEKPTMESAPARRAPKAAVVAASKVAAAAASSAAASASRSKNTRPSTTRLKRCRRRWRSPCAAPWATTPLPRSSQNSAVAARAKNKPATSSGACRKTCSSAR